MTDAHTPPIQIPLIDIRGKLSRSEALALFEKLKRDVAKMKDGGGRCYGSAQRKSG